MLRKPELASKKNEKISHGDGKVLSDWRFFHEVEALGKALAFAEPANPKPEPEPASSSRWSWKKAFSNIRHQYHHHHHRFECRFSLRVRSIDNLPPALSSSPLVVHWRRSTDPSGSHTRPVKPSRGSAVFDETLACACSVYATAAGPRRPARYEDRQFLVYAAVAGSTGFDLGKHRVELTKILPVTLEELGGEKRSGEWATSFRLSGKGRGAVLNVTFSFSAEPTDNGADWKVRETPKPVASSPCGLRRTGSVSGTRWSGPEKPRSALPRSVGDEKTLQEVVKQELRLGQSVLPIDLKPEYEVFSEPSESPEMKCCTSVAEKDYDDEPEPEFTVIEQGVEEITAKGSEIVLDQGPQKLRSVSMNLPFPDPEELGLLDYKPDVPKSKSFSLDDAAESIASEFLSMLGLENSPSALSSGGDPESPRERLWKEFEKESLTVNGPIFGPDVDCVGLSEDFDLSSMVQAAEMEHLKESLTMGNPRSRAQMLEDAETEALMQEWGLNEKAFEKSPPESISGFRSPIDLPLQELMELPPLGENLGPVVQTMDGGFLRSMSPSLFKNSTINGSLVMQASNPVVLPAEMGSDIMEILQGLASVGIEKLSMQASKLMPLEDITGRTMQQLAWEAETAQDTYERQDVLKDLNLNIKSGVGRNSSGRINRAGCQNLNSSRNNEARSEYVSLEDLSPLAMDKIETLTMEGLRIQSGLSYEEVPSNINPRYVGELSALDEKGAKTSSRSLGLEGAAGLQLLDVKDDGENVDGLMGLTITLDEWMRLDSGVVDEDDQFSERTWKVLAAHHAKSTSFLKADKRGGRSSGRRWGLLGNNFTVALMVQLRDPLRDYEPVGAPMLALIQVERVFVPPKPKIYTTVSEKGNGEADDEPDTDSEPFRRGEIKLEEDAVPQFKITEVHVAGLKTEPGKKKIWGTTVQQQSGSRWLLANGMGKTNKHSLMKAKVIPKRSHMTTKEQPGDTLWSISSRVHGTGAKWKDLTALNPHLRNPNVIFPNETNRLQ